MNSAYASRPAGRLIFFACLALLVTGSVFVHGADVTKTTVHDTINRADGFPATGTLLISWPSFRTAHNDFVAAGTTTADLVAGTFSVALVPTDGATPAGVQYRVVLHLTGESPEVQYWTVPATGDTGIHLAGNGNGSDAARPPAADSSLFVLKAGDMMMGPLLLSGPPTIPNGAATRQYVDEAISLSASKSYVDTALAPLATTQYVDNSLVPMASKQYVDSSIAPLASTQFVNTAVAPLATTQYVDAAIAPTATKQYVDSSIAPLATTQYVDASVAPTATKQYVDTSIASMATKQYVDSAVAPLATTQFVNTSIAPLATTQSVTSSIAAKTARTVKDYGAICDGTGSHDDTSAFQSAINSFAGKGGILRIPDGCLVTSALTFPTTDGVHRGSLVIQLEGSLFLKATLELPNNVSLVGSGAGSGAVQFQIGPSARLEDWTNTLDPILKLTGGTNYVENITIPWGPATGIKLDGAVAGATGALARLHNVGVLTNGHPLVINNYFWVWARDSRFLNTGATDTVWITNSTSSAVGTSGIIYFDDDILSGGGMRVDSQVTANNIGSLYINRMIRENGTGPLLTLDATHGDVEIVSLDHVADADPINVQDQVHIVSPTSGGRIYGLRIVGQPPSIGGDTARAQIFFDGNDDTRSTDINLGSQRLWNYSIRSRVWDIENVGNDSAFSAVPYTPLPVNQDPTTWPGGGGTWTQGVTAPDGSTQAATLSIATSFADAQVYRSTLSVAVNDWVIAGVYVKGPYGSVPAQPMFSFAAGTLPMFESGANYFYLPPRGFYDSQWRLALAYAKVSSAGGGLADYILSLRADSTHSVSYAFPFVIRIPATANISDVEVQRWARSLTRNVVSNVPAGNYALRSYQRLYFSSDTYLARTAAGQLGVNGTAFALSTDISTHTAATAAHGATGAVVGTTNAQTLQNKTLDSTNSVAGAAVTGVPDCQDSSGNHLNYTAGTKTFSCGTTSGAVNEWTTGAAYATATAITMPAQNTTRLWAISVPIALNNPTKIAYYVSTADNTSNLYDIGIYKSSGSLVCHSGAVAGTTFSSATGVKNISFVAGCGAMTPGRYYVALTTTCSSSCAAITQINTASSTAVISPVSAANPSSGSATTSGALNSSVGIPADSWAAGQLPAIYLHQ